MAIAGADAVGPVSPPPMTMTCLPLALIGFGLPPAHLLVLRDQELQRRIDALQLTARDRQVARHFEPVARITASNSLWILFGRDEVLRWRRKRCRRQLLHGRR